MTQFLFNSFSFSLSFHRSGQRQMGSAGCGLRLLHRHGRHVQHIVYSQSSGHQYRQVKWTFDEQYWTLFPPYFFISTSLPCLSVLTPTPESFFGRRWSGCGRGRSCCDYHRCTADVVLWRLYSAGTRKTVWIHNWIHLYRDRRHSWWSE